MKTLKPLLFDWKNVEVIRDLTGWRILSRYYELPEEFIEKYINKVDLEFIAQYQKLSEKFIEKYIDRLRLMSLMDNINISRGIKVKFFKKVAKVNDKRFIKRNHFLLIYTNRLFFRKKFIYL